MIPVAGSAMVDSRFRALVAAPPSPSLTGGKVRMRSPGGAWFVGRFGLLVVPVLLSAGCATSSASGTGGPLVGQPGSAAADITAGDGAADDRGGPGDTARAEQERLEALYWDRIQEARGRFTEADVHFMSAMIGHHAQALVMTDLAPDRASDPSVRTLSARIRSSQADEITLMQQWLRDRGQVVPEFHIEGASLILHGDHGAHDHRDMPGMLSNEQLAELERAAGADFDRLFLQYMIEHHRGAVAMVHELFATDAAGQDPDVFRFASDVQVDQTTEVARMERMLQEMAPRGGTP